MCFAPIDVSAEAIPAFLLAPRAIQILLVDDDALVRRLLQTILERAGYTVLAAEDGPTAIEISMWASFDMLITDFQMPGMNGFLLADTITERRPGLPVLLTSGAFIEELPIDWIFERGWSFLPKPVDRVRLLETIDECCRSGRHHHSLRN